jgi:hypothetical protein
VNHPRMAYARPSFDLSVMKTTEPLATPTEPANAPCTSRIHIACHIVFDSPKAVTEAALPNSVTTRTNRRPYFLASEAYIYASLEGVSKTELA